MIIEWIKALHVISIISWMAGLLYLPRIFVYHAGSQTGSDKSNTFKIMEYKLFKYIMGPSMMASWIFGLWLIHITKPDLLGWFSVKVLFVIMLTIFHIFCGMLIKEFANDQRNRSSLFFRSINEFPTIAMIIIVIMVIIKPF